MIGKDELFLWDAEEPLENERWADRVASASFELIEQYLYKKYGTTNLSFYSDRYTIVENNDIEGEDKRIGTIKIIDVLEDNFVPKEVKVELGVFGIVLTGTESDIENNCAYDNGTITSDLLETCSYCNDPACEMECMEYQEHCSDRDMDCQIEKQKEGQEFRLHRAAAHAVESMVLAHWCAGVDVTTPAYKEGIETTFDALTNNL